VIFEPLHTVYVQEKVVIRFAGKLWLERGQSTTVWRIGSLGNTYGKTTGDRIWHFGQTPPKIGSWSRPYGPLL